MAEKTQTLDSYLGKAPTTLQARFADWLHTEVGYDPNAAKSKAEAFKEGVRLATATRMVFQASDYNRAARAEEQANRPEPEPATERPAKKTAAPAKKAPPAKRAAKKAAPAVANTEEDTADNVEAAQPQAQAQAKPPARRAPARRSTGAAASAPF